MRESKRRSRPAVQRFNEARPGRAGSCRALGRHYCLACHRFNEARPGRAGSFCRACHLAGCWDCFNEARPGRAGSFDVDNQQRRLNTASMRPAPVGRDHGPLTGYGPASTYTTGCERCLAER